MGYTPTDKPLSLKQLRAIYEAELPAMLEERDRQIALLRGGKDDKPESWWPEWNEEQAEDSFTNAVELRSLFDPDLKLAKRWIAYVSKENPQARKLERLLHQASNRVLEILYEWKDLTLLSFAIITWNLIADRIIELWDKYENAATEG